jgi:hypothetical protein
MCQFFVAHEEEFGKISGPSLKGLKNGESLIKTISTTKGVSRVYP